MWILLFLILLLLLVLFLFISHFTNIERFNCDKTKIEIEKYPRESLDVFFDAKFKPECCPSPYSNSSGCLCAKNKDAGIITSRGGNRIMC